MQEVDVDTILKIIIVGNGQVGKTSLLTRFATGKFTDMYKKTIGTDFMEKEIFIKSVGQHVKLMLWDTAGQEMFSQLTKNYYKGAGACVYVFSTVDRESFLEIEKWKRKVEEECGKIPSVLVQNKIDLLEQATVKSVEVEDLARRSGMKLYRVCVKDNLQVNDVFDYVTELYLKGGHNISTAKPVPEIGDLSSQKKNKSDESMGRKSSLKAPDKTEDGVIKLEPSKRRTDGKKSICLI